MSSYTAAGLEVLALVVPLLLVGAFDVWCHVWRTPKNGAPVNTGKTPSTPTQQPR